MEKMINCAPRQHSRVGSRDAEVLQEAAVLVELVFQRLVGDLAAVVGIGIFEHGAGKVFDLILGKLHSVLLDAVSYHVVELLVLDESIA